ncbi:MAG TPA: hypothetical protein VLC09_01990, partial [Polyangiaceae bacterium]|nr:hypothetical protein [Polyangiaceae bacterium]
MRSSLAPPFTQRAVAVACLLGLTLGPRSARAQANYDAALIGGRSSLQGGTGVAAGTDAAAPLQNPATTLDIAGTSFVFSTMFLQLSQRSSEGTLPEAVQPTRLGQTQFGVLPNSTCVFADLAGSNQRRQGHQKLSICLNQPEQENYLFEARTLVEGSATLFQNRHLEQTFSKKSYSIGWAYGLSEWVGLGVTAQLEEIG